MLTGIRREQMLSPTSGPMVNFVGLLFRTHLETNWCRPPVDDKDHWHLVKGAQSVVHRTGDHIRSSAGLLQACRQLRVFKTTAVCERKMEPHCRQSYTSQTFSQTRTAKGFH